MPGTIPQLAPPHLTDPVIDAFRADIDTSLIEQNLKLTPAQRIRKAERFIRSLDKVRGLARQSEDLDQE